MNFEDLSPEQKEKARACKTIDELISFAEEEGFKLTNEELEGIAGGICKRDCNWLGAVCINDVDCRTNKGCSDLFSCPQFSNCSDLFRCPIDSTSTPASSTEE